MVSRLSFKTRLAVFVLLIIGAIFVTTDAKAAPMPTASASAQPCTVTGDWINIGQGPSVRVTETGTCTESDIVSLALWYATSLDGNPLSSQERVSVLRDESMPVGTYDVDIPYIADGACFWQVDLAWGHAPSNLSTPYGSKLIRAWHGGVTDCVTKTTPPPTPSATVTTPVPVPSTAAPTTAPVPSATATTPAPTTPVATPTHHKPKPKPTATHHKPKPKPTHHKPVPTPSASGCIASGCDKPTPAPTTSTPTKPELPMTGGETTEMIVIAVGLISAGGGVLLSLAYFKRKGMLQ